MSSEPFDVLATAFLWIVLCIVTPLVFVRVAGDEKPPAPLFTICLHHVEPQTVPPAPLLPVDIPPPREPREPAVAPQAQPEPLPEGLPPVPVPEPVELAVALRPEPQPHRPTRRNDRIPRGERRLRPTVSAERPIQRERHMTEMSTRDRIAACDREAAQERYEAHKAQEFLWRRKAIDHERKQEAASRTGGQAISADSAPAVQSSALERPSDAGRDGADTPGDASHSQEPTDKASDTFAAENGDKERKQLNIDSEAANNFTGIKQFEKPTHGWSNAHIGTALGDKSDTAYASPMEYEKTTETQSDNPLLNLNDNDAANGLNAELIELQDAEIDGLADAAWDRKVLLVYTHWLQWITRGNTIIWDVGKLKEAQIERLEPIVEDMFAIFQKRCGKRNVNSPADGLDETLAIVSLVRGNMKKALDYLKGINADQPATLDQPPSATYGQFTSDEQLANDQQVSFYQEQAQIEADRELAESRHLQETPQVTTFASSSRIQNEQAGQQPDPPNIEQLDTLSVNKVSTSPQEGSVAAAPAHSGGIRASRWATADDVTQTPNPSNTEQLETLPDFNVSTPTAGGGGIQAPRYANAVDPREATVAAVPTLGGGIEDSGYASADDDMIGIEEQTNTATIKTLVNPLLGLHPSDAWKELASSLSEATSSDPSIHDKAWCQTVHHIFVCWLQWMESMERNGVNIWSHVEGGDLVQFAVKASAAHNSINLQYWPFTSEIETFRGRIAKAIKDAEQEQARIFEEQQRQERIRTTEMRQRQLAAEQEEKQARIDEQQRQEELRASRMQSQQHPLTQQQSWSLPQKVEPITEYVQTTGPNRMGVESPSTQPDPATQQQHVGAATIQQDQQAPAAPLANVNALPAMRQSTQGEPQTNAANMTAQKTEQLSQNAMDTSATDTGARDVPPAVQIIDPRNKQPTLVQVHYPTNEKQKQLQDSYRMSQDRTKDDEAAAKEALAEKGEEARTTEKIATENALAHGWRLSDIKLEDGVYPLQGEVRFSDQDLVLVTTWLKLNNELVKTLQKFKQFGYKRRATSTSKIGATSITQGEVFMAKVQQMSYRYCQLRQYTCVESVEVGGYDWNVGRISLKDIKENGLKEYIRKDEEFLTAVRNSFNTPDEDGIDEIRELEIDDCRRLVLEAHDNVMAVSHAIKRILQ